MFSHKDILSIADSDSQHAVNIRRLNEQIESQDYERTAQ